jgi:hypothetical protein
MHIGKLFVHYFRRLYVVTENTSFSYNGDEYKLYRSFTDGHMDDNKEHAAINIEQPSGPKVLVAGEAICY